MQNTGKSTTTRLHLMNVETKRYTRIEEIIQQKGENPHSVWLTSARKKWTGLFHVITAHTPRNVSPKKTKARLVSCVRLYRYEKIVTNEYLISELQRVLPIELIVGRSDPKVINPGDGRSLTTDSVRGGCL